jgi:TonB-dependent starch-binding outer membrane protein SusC
MTSKPKLHKVMKLTAWEHFPCSVRKAWMVMRITTLLLLIGALHLSANTSAQKITLSSDGITMEQFFSQLTKQTGYSFLLENGVISPDQKIAVHVTAASLEEVLDQTLNPLHLSYTIDNKMVFVRQAKFDPAVSSDSEIPPTDIHGHVTDSLGNPLQGATVTVKGSKIASTITDDKGNFLLVGIASNATLIISNIGFETQEFKLKGKSDISLKLKIHSTSLLDVVVNKGYYNTTQQFNTGDVSTVKGEDIEKQPVANPLLALQGRVPGLIITQQTGVPGAAVQVQLRGQNSIANGNDPLYIVDGVPFIAAFSPTSVALVGSVAITPFTSINPSDIERIDVLKDADATAIYGSRGANGVILITTKKGKTGNTKVDANVYSGWGKVNREVHLLNTPQYLEMRHEAFNNDGLTTSSPEYSTAYDINGTWDTTRYTDWQKVFEGGTAKYSDAQLSVSGGNENTHYLIGAGYHKETSIFPGEFNDTRGSVHVNLSNSSSNQRFKINFSGFYSVDNNNMPASNLSSFSTLPPDAPALYDSTGKLNWQNSTWINPLSYLLRSNISSTNNLNGRLNLNYNILTNLDLGCNFGYNNIYINNTNTVPLASYDPAQTYQQAHALYSNSSNETWIIEPQINFHKQTENLRFDALLGGTFSNQVQKSESKQGVGYPSDALLQDIDAAGVVSIIGVGYSIYRYDAIFGRLGFNWQGKYLINLTARRDGSSRFGPGKQFGNFGAIGAGWIFTKEKLIAQNLSFLSFGKFRASYGTSGNDQIGDYNYLNAYSPNVGPYQGIGTISPVRLSNPDYAWELNKKLEGGLELGFFKDQIHFSISWFRNRTDDQLLPYTVSGITGFASVIENLPATVQNTGLELTFNTVNIKTKDFGWTSFFNLSIPKNKLVAYPNLATSSYSYQYIIGQPLGIAQLLHNTGVNPQTGLYSFQDFNHDGMLSYPDDYKIIEYVGPQFYGGLQNSFNYKNWQLDFFFQFVEHKNGSNFLAFSGMPGTMQNQLTYVLNRWQKPGNITDIQKFSNDNSDASTNYFYASTYSDRKLTDESYIRLKNLSLSWFLPAKWLQKAHVQNARVYFQGQNLLIITRYLGYDPEFPGYLPPLRVYTFGIQIDM